MSNKIKDNKIDFSNYANFKSCKIRDNGKSIRFIMVNGAQYDVPMEYFLSWFTSPHYRNVDNKLIDFDETMEHPDPKKSHFTNWEIILSATAVRIYLDYYVYTVPWDTILMACEPRYEHFGGLTEESKANVRKWWELKS